MTVRREAIPSHAAEPFAVFALVLFAVVVRLWHVAWGLPDFTEEAIPLHLSLAMRSLSTGAIDWNPHAFSYPSLGIYLHLWVQQLVYFTGRGLGQWTSPADFKLAFDLGPTPMVLAARGLGVACDALSVLAAWRIGRRHSMLAGALAGSLIALSASFVVTSRSIYVDSIAVCLALWSLERMLAWHASGGRSKLLAAAVAVGLAAGAKYPAAVMLLPLGLLVLTREDEDGNRDMAGRWRRVLFTCAVATLVFLASTPFAVFDTPAFLRDFRFEGMHASEGHFGSVDHRSFGFHLANLVRELGWPAVLLAAAAPGLVWNDRKRRPVMLAVVLIVLAFGLPISLARIDAVRYLLPVTAAVALLAAIAADELARRIPERRRVPASALIVAVLGMTPVLSGANAIMQGGRDTQIEARLWCERHVQRDQVVITEGYGPRLADVGRIAALQEAPEYRLASARWRAKVDARPALRVVAVPLAVSGRLENVVQDPAGASRRLVVAPHASAIVGVYYAPALYAGADWFITTSAVRGRYEADSSRYAAPCRLYALLSQHAEVAARFQPGRGTSGPEIVIYQIGERARTALSADGALDPLWWTAAIPQDYRMRVAPLIESGTNSTDRTTGAGDLEPWVKTLTPLYLERLALFVGRMTEAMTGLGRWAAATPIALANHRMMPDDVPSAVQASACLMRTGRWPEARAVLERTRSALAAGTEDPALELSYARALARTGDAARARSVYSRLERSLPATNPVSAAAKAERERLEPGSGAQVPS